MRCATEQQFLDAISPRGKHFRSEGEPYRMLFRGHADARFALLPSAQRPRWNTAPTNQDQLSYELGAIQNFFWLADRCGLALPEDSQIHRRDLFSDVGRRKALILLGYGMAALTKPLFPWATSAGAVFIARFLDRIGKGIRGAPRDALVADVAPPAIRGACFGLRQSMDTVGGFLGPSLAIFMMILFANDIRQVLWFAVVPALITVFLIVFGIEDPEGMSARHRFRSPIRLDALKQISGDYWRVVAIGAIFTLARFSEAFLVLRAQQVGFANKWVPLVMIVMSLAYSFSAYPAGILSDRVNRPVPAGGGHCASHPGRFRPRLG